MVVGIGWHFYKTFVMIANFTFFYCSLLPIFEHTCLSNINVFEGYAFLPDYHVNQEVCNF